MSNTYGFGQVGKPKGRKAPASPPGMPINLNNNVIYNAQTQSFIITKADIKATIEWSARQNSPVTGAPCHPHRHDTESKVLDSNPFALLADSDRQQHSLVTSGFVEFVYEALTARLGQNSLKWMRTTCTVDTPRRLIFSVPKTALRVGIRGTYFEHGEMTGEGDAQGAMLIVDGDGLGRVYIVTGYGTQDLPPDAGNKAGGYDCCYRPSDQILTVDDGEKLSHQLVGTNTAVVTVEEKGGRTIERKHGVDTQYGNM
jgi:hypothetical protein